MNAAISGILSDVVVDTLQKLAFLSAVPLEGAAPEDTRELATVRVRFSGPLCGGMQLSLSRPVLAELAGNMLGADDGSALSADEQHDALRELINVICGNLLPLIVGKNAECRGRNRPPQLLIVRANPTGHMLRPPAPRPHQSASLLGRMSICSGLVG